MRKFCLSYDAKNHNDWPNSTLKLAIAIELLENGAINLSNPVASTILFEDDANISRIKYWKQVLENEFEGEMFYYLCQVAKYNNDQYIEIDKGDPDMEAEFRETLKRAHNEIAKRKQKKR